MAEGNRENRTAQTKGEKNNKWIGKKKKKQTRNEAKGQLLKDNLQMKERMDKKK